MSLLAVLILSFIAKSDRITCNSISPVFGARFNKFTSIWLKMKGSASRLIPKPVFNKYIHDHLNNIFNLLEYQIIFFQIASNWFTMVFEVWSCTASKLIYVHPETWHNKKEKRGTNEITMVIVIMLLHYSRIILFCFQLRRDSVSLISCSITFSITWQSAYLNLFIFCGL